MKSLVKTCFT